jgi:predicted RNA-binding protein YlxR (DUF448 family)
VLGIRFVRSPEGVVVPDLKGSLPGRGAWTLPERSAVAAAARRGFARSFKAEVSVPGGPDGFAEEVRGLLLSRALSALGLARRAGQLHAGFDAVRERGSELSAYVTSEDASPDGVRKVAGKVAAAAGVPHILVPVTGVVLSASIGEPGAVHLGLTRGKAGLAAKEALQAFSLYDERDTMA